MKRPPFASWATLALAAAALVQLVLLVLLVPPLGAAGAAIAYGLSMCGMYITFAVIGLRELRILQADSRT